MHEGFLFSISSPTFLLKLMIAILTGMRWYFVLLIRISLMISNVDHLCVFFGEMSLHILCPVFNRIVRYFLVLSYTGRSKCRFTAVCIENNTINNSVFCVLTTANLLLPHPVWVLYVFWVVTLLGHIISAAFSHSLGSFFLLVSFTVQKLQYDIAPFIYFSFVSLDSRRHIQNKYL